MQSTTGSHLLPALGEGEKGFLKDQRSKMLDKRILHRPLTDTYLDVHIPRRLLAVPAAEAVAVMLTLGCALFPVTGRAPESTDW